MTALTEVFMGAVKKESMMLIDNKFDIGQIVYSRVDTEQMPMQINQLLVLKDSPVKYGCQSAHSFAWYCDFEITTEKLVELTL